MRIVLLILSALLSFSVLAPLSAAATTGNTAMAMTGSDAQHNPDCPDECCEDCPDFTQCQMGCAVAVLPVLPGNTQPLRFTPADAEPVAPHHSANLPPVTPPPRAAAQL